MPVTVLLAARAGARQPTGALFDVVLLLHVTFVVIGMGTLVVSGVQGWRLWAAGRSAAPVPDTLARYYGPGANWAGRTIYGIPVLGLTLLGLSRGVFGLQLPWVAAGSAIWVVGAVVAEAVLWPAERRIGRHLQEGAGPGADGPRRATDGRRAPSGAVVAGSGRPPLAAVPEARLVAGVAFGLVALFLVASVLMVAQP